MNSKKMKLIALFTVGTLVLSGCLSNIKVIDKTNPETNTTAVDSKITGSGTSSNTNNGTSTSKVATTSELALKAYEESLKKRKSDKYTVTWLIESNLPAKSGMVVSENIYGENGKVVESKGEVSETYGGKTKKSTWYRTKTQYVTDQSGNYKRYNVEGLKEVSTYNFQEFIRTLFSKYNTQEEGEFWVLKANSNDKSLNAKLMNFLGYNRTESDAWEGKLYAEVKVIKDSGNIANIIYTFTHHTNVVTDTGEVKFSNFNLINPIVIPEEVLSESIPADGNTTSTKTTKPTGSTSTQGTTSTGSTGP